MTGWGDELAGCFPEGRWRGRWIWADGADDPGDSARTVVALRRDLPLDQVAACVPARMLAVSRYVLWVNGHEVARGPMRANPRRQPYDVVDLAPHLRPGTNSVAVLAWRYLNPMPWWLPPSVRNDLPLGAFVLDARTGPDSWLTTDASWTGLALDGWSATPPDGVSGRGTETIDARWLPADWQEVGGADAWSAAHERTAALPAVPLRPEPPSYPYGCAAPRAIPWPSATHRPLAPAAPDAWTTTELVAGTVHLDVEGPAGAVVTVQVAERLSADGRPMPTEDDARFVVVCDGSRRTIEPLEPYGLTGLTIDAPAGVVVHDVAVIERLHPVTGDASFHCSDERLDTIWSVGRRTVSLCSWDAYLDCPTRELRGWTGDAVVHQLVDLTTNADWSLARWYCDLTASPRADGMLPMAVGGEIEHNDTLVIADWALHWVRAVWNLYRYVGDREEIAGLLPVVERVVRWFDACSGARGYPVDINGAILIDWASVYVDDACSSLCGLWGRALLDFAEMAEWLDDRGRAAWARAAHARLARGFEDFWDPDRQRYVDVLVGGEQRPMASQHGQAAALIGGLAPAERHARLVELMTDEAHLVHACFGVPDGPALPNSEENEGAYLSTGRPEPWWDVEHELVRAQPFFLYAVHDALVQAGRPDLIAAACLEWTVALERCPTTWNETWYGGTICHGWSSTPTRDLVQHVLGVQPAEPGFAVASVEPHLGHLTFASGAAPTPNGMLRVEATRDRLTVDAPIPFVHRGQRYEPGRHEIRTV